MSNRARGLSRNLTLSAMLAASAPVGADLTPIKQLGQHLYFDENLSEPAGQSCASCHDPGFAFVDPDKGQPASEGVILGLFGGRNSPSAAYAMYSPIRYFDEQEGLWIGGQFWDSRATGEELGDPLADQALGPFLNSVEMNNPAHPGIRAVQLKIRRLSPVMPGIGRRPRGLRGRRGRDRRAGGCPV
jgi:cytochrome c peroxidase